MVESHATSGLPRTSRVTVDHEALFDWARQFQRPPCDHRWVEIGAVGVGIIGGICTKCGESQCVHEWIDKKTTNGWADHAGVARYAGEERQSEYWMM